MQTSSKKRSVLLLISAILGIVYAVYIISYFTGVVSGAEAGPETAGAVIAGTLVAPHAVCAGVAAIFNALAWALSSRPFALTSGVLYAVSMVLFPMYFMFVIIQTVCLSWASHVCPNRLVTNAAMNQP